ncbi:MAG: hypothetical protein PHS88_11275 [Candidatus Omnitrophica bacterium]|nr:hypothetical protein [Candidatus Omnitrophota bacterium]
MANEQEFTDRLTGALGLMVERYGVNRVMHAYFSAPGSFDVNGVLLEDEPNIPTVKKGYSFMMKIGAALNAKYPRPAVLGSIPVMTDHDATAGAKGEMNKVFGTLQAIPAESMTIFYIIAGTGVGSRIMVRGQPFLGDERVSFLHNEVHPIVFNRNEVNPDFTYTALETRGLHPDFTNEFLADGVTPNPNYQGEDLEDRTSGPRIAKRAQELVQDMIDYPANYTEDEVNDARCLAYAVARTDLIDTRLLGEAANANPRYEEAVRNGYGVAGYAAADQWTQLPMPRLLPGGNRLAQRIIRERAMELGIGLVVDIVESKKIWPELLLPDHVVVGSGVAQIGQLFLDGVREGVRRRTAQYKATGEVDFIGADFDENAFARRFILSEIADDTAREFFGGLPTVESANHFQRKIEQTQQRSETRQEESEREIVELATTDRIQEAIRVFTLNRHTFDPEAIGRLTEVLEANYQGPVAIVGKVGGSTWAFEAGTPWGLLGYRIAGRTNEKEDGTPVANEQEFTDRLTGALGQMVERYGVNRVMHAYFSAPGSFDVNGVLLEDEPNIPTVKKGYSFMIKIGASLNAKYPRPAALGTIPVMTDHDATAGAKGEMNKVFGTLQAINAEDMTIFYVIAGTGVGTRFMVRHQPFLGDERVSFLHNEVHPLVFNRNEVNPDFAYTALETHGLHPDFTNEFLADGVTPNPNYQGEDLEDRTSGPKIAAYAAKVIRKILENPDEYGPTQVLDAKILYYLADGDLSKLDTKILGHAANGTPAYMRAALEIIEEYSLWNMQIITTMNRNGIAERAIRARAMELGIGLAVDLVESKRIWPELPLPDHVVVGSGVAQIGQLFLDGVREGVRRRMAQYKASGEVDFIGADFNENEFAERFVLSEIADDTAREFFGGLPTVEGASAYQTKVEQVQQRSETRETMPEISQADAHTIIDAMVNISNGYTGAESPTHVAVTPQAENKSYFVRLRNPEEPLKTVSGEAPESVRKTLEQLDLMSIEVSNDTLRPLAQPKAVAESLRNAIESDLEFAIRHLADIVTSLLDMIREQGAQGVSQQSQEATAIRIGNLVVNPLPVLQSGGVAYQVERYRPRGFVIQDVTAYDARGLNVTRLSREEVLAMRPKAPSELERLEALPRLTMDDLRSFVGHARTVENIPMAADHYPGLVEGKELDNRTTVLDLYRVRGLAQTVQMVVVYSISEHRVERISYMRSKGVGPFDLQNAPFDTQNFRRNELLAQLEKARSPGTEPARESYASRVLEGMKTLREAIQSGTRSETRKSAKPAEMASRKENILRPRTPLTERLYPVIKTARSTGETMNRVQDYLVESRLGQEGLPATKVAVAEHIDGVMFPTVESLSVDLNISGDEALARVIWEILKDGNLTELHPEVMQIVQQYLGKGFFSENQQRGPVKLMLMANRDDLQPKNVEETLYSMALWLMRYRRDQINVLVPADLQKELGLNSGNLLVQLQKILRSMPGGDEKLAGRVRFVAVDGGFEEIRKTMFQLDNGESKEVETGFVWNDPLLGQINRSRITLFNRQGFSLTPTIMVTGSYLKDKPKDQYETVIDLRKAMTDLGLPSDYAERITRVVQHLKRFAQAA